MNKAQNIIYEDIKEVVKSIGGEFNILAGKVILLTGSNGLLGSYLSDTVKYLNDTKLKEPCKLIGINRSKIKKYSRNYHLTKDKNFKFLTHNASKPVNITGKVDYIIHAACSSTPAVFQEYPLETVDVNVDGIRWLLDLAIKKNSKSVLYFSSGEIYGTPPPKFIPTSESYNGNVSPLDPRACYRESKRLAETLCKIYYDKFNVPIKITRPFVIYGPGVSINDKKVLSDFMKYAINKKRIEMLSEGLDIRSDCYISDATTAFWKILLSDFNGEVFNVGNDKQEFTVKQLAETVHKICGILEPPIYNGVPTPKHLQTSPKRFCPDVTKLKEKLKFDTTIPLYEGLRRTIEWNREIMKQE